MQIKDIKL